MDLPARGVNKACCKCVWNKSRVHIHTGSLFGPVNLSETPLSSPVSLSSLQKCHKSQPSQQQLALALRSQSPITSISERRALRAAAKSEYISTEKQSDRLLALQKMLASFYWVILNPFAGYFLVTKLPSHFLKGSCDVITSVSFSVECHKLR